jgi:prevent-host-death family protein
MLKVEATAARNGFSDLLNQVRYRSDRVLIERRGKGTAVLIPMEDLRLLELVEDTIDINAARKALANPKNKNRVSLEDVKKRLGLYALGVPYRVEFLKTDPRPARGTPSIHAGRARSRRHRGISDRSASRCSLVTTPSSRVLFSRAAPRAGPGSEEGVCR